MSPYKSASTGKEAKTFTGIENVLKAPSLSSSAPAKTYRKRQIKKWLALTIVTLLTLTAVTYTTVAVVADWFDRNQIVRHNVIEVQLHAPFTIEKREQELLSPVPQSAITLPSLTVQAYEQPEVKQVVVTPDVSRMVRAIRMLESSNGTAESGLAVFCKGKGLSNEYGFGGMKMMKCFATAEEATDRVTRWVTEHLAKFDNNEEKTMCWYNLGLEQESCKYSDDYLKIKDSI